MSTTTCLTCGLNPSTHKSGECLSCRKKVCEKCGKVFVSDLYERCTPCRRGKKEKKKVTQ